MSVFFHTDMLFLVGGSILCHAGLESCKVLTGQDKEKNNNGEKKQSSHLLCPGATGQGAVNNVPKVRWPQCLERQIIEL